MEYTGHLGAHGDTMLGDITLISDQALPGVKCSNSVEHTVDVKKAGILPGIPGFETIILFTGLIIVMFLYSNKRIIKK